MASALAAAVSLGGGACVRLKFTVIGHVQGVFFRKHTKETADKLGLTGWVMNCEDGSVEGEAEGPPEAIAAFATWLRRGPSRARVDDVRTDTHSIAATDRVHHGFVIRR